MGNTKIRSKTVLKNALVASGGTVLSQKIDLNQLGAKGSFSVQYIITGSGTGRINYLQSSDGKSLTASTNYTRPVNSILAHSLTASSGIDLDGKGILNLYTIPSNYLQLEVVETSGSDSITITLIITTAQAGWNIGQGFKFEQKSGLAFSPTLGINMAVDAAFSGTPDLINDGGDNAGWTGSNITGTKVTFNSTEQAHDGTNSIKVDAPALNNIWQFDKGSTFTPASYIALTMWIYVDSSWTLGDSVSIYGYDTGGAVQVGDSVLLEDFVNETDFGVWHKATIPMEDFNFAGGTFDAFRMQLVGKHGATPVFFIDQFQAEEAGGAEEFLIESVVGEMFNISRFTLVFVGSNSETLADNSYPHLDPDKILDVTLPNGILLTRKQNGAVAFSVVFLSLSNMLVSGGTIGSVVGTATKTILTIDLDFDVPVAIDSSKGDNLSFIISDDLTGWESFTAVARGNFRPL